MPLNSLRGFLEAFFRGVSPVPRFKIIISVAYLVLFAATLFISEIRQQNHITVHGWFATGSPALVVAMFGLTILFLTRRGVVIDRRKGTYELLEERDARHEKMEVWGETEQLPGATIPEENTRG